MSESILSLPAAQPDEVVRWGPEPDQVADLRLGSPDQPLVIVIHGGFWRPRTDRTHTRHMTLALAERGYTVVSAEYRRVLGSPDLTMDDIRVALHVLPTSLHGYFNGRVILMGHSAGAHLALWAAAESPPPGLLGTIAMAPISDLVAADAAHLGNDALRDFLGVPALDRPDLDPARQDHPAQRTVLLAGGQDDEVPAAISDGYVRAHPAVEFEVISAAGHYSFIDPTSAAWPMIIETLRSVSTG